MKVTRRRFLLALGAGAAACAGAGAYAVAVEPTWLRTYECDIPVRGLPAAFDGYRIAQLSDLHIGGGVPESQIREAVRRCVAADVDLVALTGDFVQGPRVEDSARIVGRALADLRAADGVFAVLGNHDAGVYASHHTPDRVSLATVRAALATANIRTLDNEAVTIARDSERMVLCGLGDLWSGDFHPDRLPPRVKGAPTLALSHNPDTAPELAERGIEVVLSGHTHGGQVSIPFIGPPRLPVRRKDLAAGLCRVGETVVYVNRGVGWLRRIRFGVRPEVSLLRLRPA